MASLSFRVVRGAFSAALIVSAATLLSLLFQATAVTAGFVYLISILVLTIWQGFVAGTLGSILAAACFNYFFFQPIGTFQIADPHNWVSLGCFLVAAIIASRLVSREHERASEAQSRQREIEALYNLCLELFTAGTAPGGLDAATSRALTTIGCQGGGLVLDAGSAAEPGDAWVGSPKDLEMHRLLGSATTDTSGGAQKRWRNVSIPISIGGHRAGNLVAYGTRANRETLESVARLLGLALERERFLAERARLEALKQSDTLKTTLLRAISHDLYTPLTSVLVSIESLKRSTAGDPVTSEAVELIATETSQLHRRIQNLLDHARLQAGLARAHRDPTPAADLFRSARENLPYITSNRRIESAVEEGCPDLDVDPSLALEILVNLIENSHRASPSEAPISLVARRHPDESGRIFVEVLDRGKGLAPPDRAPEPEPSDTSHKGLGLEIARSFATALDGTLSLLTREGGGVCARLELPASIVPDVSLVRGDA